MSTQTYSQSACNTPPIAILAESARTAAATYARALTVKAQLDAQFTKRRLTATPAEYSALRDRCEQQNALVEDARVRNEAAEAAHAAAQFEASQQDAVRVRLQRLQAIDVQLAATTEEIDRLQLELNALPEKIYRVKAQAMRLMAERSSI